MNIKSGIGANINNSSDFKSLYSSKNKNQLVIYTRESANSESTKKKKQIACSNPFKLKDYKNNNNVKFQSIVKQEESQQVIPTASNPFSKKEASVAMAAVRSGYKVELSESGKSAIQKLNNMLSTSQYEITKKDMLKQELSSFYRATLGRKVTRSLAFSI